MGKGAYAKVKIAINKITKEKFAIKIYEREKLNSNSKKICVYKEEMADLEEFFKEQIKPYEERIKKLEELDKKKDVEITLLKAAIEHMKAEIEKLKAQLEKNKLIGPSTGSKTGRTGAKHK